MLSSRFQDGSRNTSCNHTTLCQTQWEKNNNFSLSDYSPANQENSQVASLEFQHRWKQAGRMKQLWGRVRAQGWNNGPRWAQRRRSSAAVVLGAESSRGWERAGKRSLGKAGWSLYMLILEARQLPKETLFADKGSAHLMGNVKENISNIDIRQNSIRKGICIFNANEKSSQ